MGSIRVACCSPVVGRVTGGTDRAQPNSSAPGLRYLDKDNLVSCPRNSRYIVAIKMGRRLGKRVGGSACWRIGVWGSKTAFRHGYNDQEVSAELMMLCKRRHADTPIRRYVSPSRPIFTATLWAGASSLFFCVARSTRMTQIWVFRSRLEKQPTDLRQYTCYFGDRTLGWGRQTALPF
jgi:hypothetical protein